MYSNKAEIEAAETAAALNGGGETYRTQRKREVVTRGRSIINASIGVMNCRNFLQLIQQCSFFLILSASPCLLSLWSLVNLRHTYR